MILDKFTFAYLAYVMRLSWFQAAGMLNTKHCKMNQLKMGGSKGSFLMTDEKLWYRLNNVGKLYSFIISPQSTTLFRISATLTSNISPAILQQALKEALRRYPFFQVQLKKGIFWYYFEETTKVPEVMQEVYYPCMGLSMKKRGAFPFRVLYFNRKISLEISHSMTDGSGASLFLKELIMQYLQLKESISFKEETVTNKQLKKENEDAFLNYYDKKVPALPTRSDNPYKLPIEMDKKGLYHITTGIIRIKDLKQQARKFNTNLNSYLLTVYIASILRIQRKKNELSRPIVINVPVDLRNYFSSETMRNFFVSITPSIDPRLGQYHFEEILEEVTLELKRSLSTKRLKQRIKHSVGVEKAFYLRMIPLPLKNMVTPYLYSAFGEKQYTSGLSNLGLFTLPDEIESYVERIECYPPPSSGNKVKCVVISFKNHAFISFGNLSSDRLLEREFFRFLRELGTDVKVETNEEVN